MKKKVLSIVLSLALVVALMPAMCVTASANDDSGTWGTCSWEISGTGENVTLTIKPKNGRSGTLKDGPYDYDGWPWYGKKVGIDEGDKAASINKVVIEKGVKAGDSTAYMFYGFKNLTEITGLENLDTSKVTDMNRMFSFCRNIESLNLTSFDTSNVTDMSGMFESCENLTTLNISSFDTSKVTKMGNMFNTCPKMKNLDLSNFDTYNVTNMNSMFNQCISLTTLEISSFDTSNVTFMLNMFNGCEKLTTLNISSFDTSNVINMEAMFMGCINLKTIYTSKKFNTGNVNSEFESKGDDYMFGDCKALVGGEGTKFDNNKTNKEYARIDGGTDNPGYFTELSKFKQFAIKVNNRINKAWFVLKSNFVKINKIFFNGKLNLSWIWAL